MVFSSFIIALLILSRGATGSYICLYDDIKKKYAAERFFPNTRQLVPPTGKEERLPGCNNYVILNSKAKTIA